MIDFMKEVEMAFLWLVLGFLFGRTNDRRGKADD